MFVIGTVGSFTSSPTVPSTNILVPSFENAMPVVGRPVTIWRWRQRTLGWRHRTGWTACIRLRRLRQCLSRTSWCRRLRTPCLLERFPVVGCWWRQRTLGWRRQRGGQRVFVYVVSDNAHHKHLGAVVLRTRCLLELFLWSDAGGVNERSGGGIKGANYEVARRVPHRPRLDRQFRRGQSRDCRAVRFSEGKRDRGAVGDSDKLGRQSGLCRPSNSPTPLRVSWPGLYLPRLSFLKR